MDDNSLQIVAKASQLIQRGGSKELQYGRDLLLGLQSASLPPAVRGSHMRLLAETYRALAKQGDRDAGDEAVKCSLIAAQITVDASLADPQASPKLRRSIGDLQSSLKLPKLRRETLDNCQVFATSIENAPHLNRTAIPVILREAVGDAYLAHSLAENAPMLLAQAKHQLDRAVALIQLASKGEIENGTLSRILMNSLVIRLLTAESFGEVFRAVTSYLLE